MTGLRNQLQNLDALIVDCLILKNLYGAKGRRLEVLCQELSIVTKALIWYHILVVEVEAVLAVDAYEGVKQIESPQDCPLWMVSHCCPFRLVGPVGPCLMLLLPLGDRGGL